MNNSWWEKYIRIIQIVFWFNLILPIILLFVNVELSRNYFVVITIGIPWIIVTVLSLYYYDSVRKSNEKLDRESKRYERDLKSKQEGLNVIVDPDPVTVAKTNLDTAISRKEMLDRGSLILKGLTLFGAFIFFISDITNNFGNYFSSHDIDPWSHVQLIKDSLDNEIQTIQLTDDSLRSEINLLKIKLDSVRNQIPTINPSFVKEVTDSIKVIKQ